METGSNSFLEELKNKLDYEMTPDVLKQFKFLLRDKLGHQSVGCDPVLTGSKVVTCLESKNKRSKVILILKHVLGVMQFHGQMGAFNFTQWVEKYKAIPVHETNEHFVGREKDVDDVYKALCSNDVKGVWIYGFGGLGKTTLATEVGSRAVWRRNIRFIIIDLKQTTTLGDMCRSILSECGRISNETELTELKMNTVDALKEVEKETWLLLDNLEHIYNDNQLAVNDLLDSLTDQDIKQVKILVTSRGNIDANRGIMKKMYRHKLLPLDDESSLQFLRIYSKPVELSDRDFRRAIEHCGNIPLALLLMANTISTLESPEKFNINMHIRDSDRIFDCIDYAFQKLASNLQKQLTRLTVFEKARFDTVAVAYVLKQSIGESLELLLQLCFVDMLQSTNASGATEHGYTYQFHEMILMYLRDKRTLLQHEDWNIVQNRFSLWVFQLLKRSHDDYYLHSRECINYIQENTQLVRTFFNTLSPDVMKTVSLPSCEHMYLAASLILSPDRERNDLIERMKIMGAQNLIVSFYCKIREIAYCIDTGCLTDADNLISCIENNWRLTSLSEHDRMIITADILSQKGRQYRKQKCTAQARDAFEAALELFKSLTSSEKRVIMKIANTLNSLGNVAHDEKDYDKALMYHEQAAEAAKNIVGNNPNHELSMFKFNIGTIALAKARQLRDISPGNKDNVAEYMTMCLRRFDEGIEEHILLGLNRNSSFADKLQVRSHARLEAKRFDGALSDALECLKLREALFGRNNEIKLMSNYLVGRIYLKQREYKGVGTQESRDALTNAKNYFNKVAGFLMDGWLTKDSPEMGSFLQDFRRMAKVTANEKYINRVEKLCTRVATGAKATSSSESSSSPSEEEPSSDSSGPAEDADCRDSGVEEMSPMVHDTGNSQNQYYFAMPSVSLCDHYQHHRSRPSLDRSLSDDVFMSSDSLQDSTVDSSSEMAKRKRDSDSD